MSLPEQVKRAIREFVFKRQTAFRKVLTGPYADTVLADLAVFCRANRSTAHPDPHMAARLDGRREVWLRIQNHIQLSDEDLWKLLGGEK